MPRKAEFFLPLLLIPLHGWVYNTVATEITAQRGVDFGPWVETPLDPLVPFVPLMVFPYMLAWIYPAFLVIGLLVRAEPVGVGIVRRIVVAVVLLELVCLSLWVAFPVQVSLRVGEEVLATRGWLGELVRLNYDLVTVWHACPSFHIAAPWFFFRAARLYRVPGLRVLLILFVVIAISTVTMRIHYLLDIVVGLAVSETVFRLTLRRFEERRSFEPRQGG